MRFTFAIILALFTQLAFGQGLTISKGGKEKVIPIGSYFEFNRYVSPSEDCVTCENESYYGQLIAVTSDSIQINYTHKDLYQKKENFILHHTEEFNPRVIPENFLTVAKKRIYSIQYYGNNSAAKKKRTNRQIFGSIAIMTGLTTGLAGLIIQNKRDKDNVLMVAAAEFGVGLLMVSISGKRKYQFQASDKVEDPWQIKS